MADRFLIQKVSSRMPPSSMSRLGAHASALVRAAAPDIPHVSAARYFNTFSCSPAAARTRWPTINSVTPALVDSVGGLKRPFSSRASRGPTIDEHAAALNRTTTAITVLATCIGLMCIGIFDKKPSGGGKRSQNRKGGSRRH